MAARVQDFLTIEITSGSWENVVLDLLSRERIQVRPGLERTARLLHELGNPEQTFRSVVVAGTNGKGSTVNYLYGMLLRSDVPAGCYTSPHLLDFRERIRAKGRCITHEELVEGLGAVQGAIGRMMGRGGEEGLEMPTPFEIFTALAFWYFRKKAVRMAAVEVGLGGRLDATNVLIPECSLITSIGLDHQGFLGNTLEEIAQEKAGIIKQGVPVFTTATGRVLEVINEVARERGSALHVITREEQPGFELISPGHHQQLNAALALAAAGYLKEQGTITLPENAMREALRATRLPGRLEEVSLPGAGNGEGRELKVVVDVAHNPSAAEVVAACVWETYVNAADPWKLSLVAGFLRDKDFTGFLRHFSFASDVTLVMNSSGRSWTEEQVGETMDELGGLGPTITCAPDLGVVLDELRSSSPTHDLHREKRLVLITGSHYTVRDFLESLDELK